MLFRSQVKAKRLELQTGGKLSNDQINRDLKTFKTKRARNFAEDMLSLHDTANPAMRAREVAKLCAFFKGVDEGDVAELIREEWRKKNFQPAPPVDSSPEIPFALLPRGSWLLTVKFELCTDLICADDDAFHAIYNPVKKSRLHGHPEYWGPSWKGVLRAAFRAVHGEPERKGFIVRQERWAACETRLFGTSKGSGEALRAGRLRFFTTSFNQIGFAIMHPSGRKPKKGEPILYETVPPGTSGVFRVLYCPFDARWSDNIEAELQDDMESAGKSVHRMFQAGIGAKSSSGFGEVSLADAAVEPSEGLESLRRLAMSGSL